MRVARLLVLGLTMACGSTTAAYAVNPNDVPWDEIDRVLKENADKPATDRVAAEQPSTPAATPAPTEVPATALPAPSLAPGLPPPHPGAGSVAVTAPAPDVVPSPPAAAEAAKPAEAAPVVETSPAPEATAPAPVQAAQPSAPASSSTYQAPTIVATDDLLYLPVARLLAGNGKKGGGLPGVEDGDRQALVQFYGSRMGSTLWVDKAGYNDAAKNLMAALADADTWGLRASDYKAAELKPGADGQISLDDLTNAEARLSIAALAYARDARGGRIPDPAGQLGTYIDRTPRIMTRRAVIDNLAAVSDKGAYLKSLQPKQPQFEALRQKLLALRSATKDAEATRVPDGPKLMPGKSHAQIALIRKILKVASPSVKADGTPADDTYYDDVLARAVEAYKEKKGIDPVNPAITSLLRRSLNSSGDISEWKLLANMEEWRWMPDDLGSFYVNVNIPEFKVRVVKDGEVVHEERIVSGRVDTQTPIFSDRMRTVVMQPRWTVPDSIKIKELLPSLRGGGNPLARQGLVMEYNGRKVDAYSVDWGRTDIRFFNVYQPPGGSNALGVVKFLFPNRHAVYLHDTPSKSLFNESVRAFSHGCMRVRNPVKLAEVILDHDKGWDIKTTDDMIAKGPEENEVGLDHPIPVHITYFTASVASDGEVQSFDDVYGHEKRIALALQGRWNEISKADEKTVSPEDVVADGDSAENWFGGGNDDDEDDDDDRHHKKHKSKGLNNFFKQVFGGF